MDTGMDIKILHLLEGADQAEGLAVVIDVFRAFSLECICFQRRTENICRQGRPRGGNTRNTLWPASGEVSSFPVLTTAILRPGGPCRFPERDLVRTTSAGTQGLVHTCAAGAEF